MRLGIKAAPRLLCHSISHVHALPMDAHAAPCLHRLPDTSSMWDQLGEGGVARLIDAIDSLPALEGVLLIIGGDTMGEDAQFASIHPGLKARNLNVASMLWSAKLFFELLWPHAFLKRVS